MIIKQALFFFIGILILSINICHAQPGGKRIQYPPGLKNAYFGINMGYINYAFSAVHLEPGFTVESVTVPHIAPRLILYGYQFSRYLSAQISYMRPVDWVAYKNINGDNISYSVWMNVGSLTMVGHLPLSKKFTLSGEAGLAIITRKGFRLNNIPVIQDANYASGLFGGALQYHLNKKWDLQLSTAWSPVNKKEKQPQTLYYSAGFNYHLRQLSPEKVAENIKSNKYFAKHFIQASYTSNAFHYGTNDLFSKTLPLFWGGAAHVKSGIGVHYQRNIFHAKKVFSLDWAAGVSYFKTRNNNESFFTISAYPVLRFTAFRSPKTDLFFEYTVAGPTYISRTLLDNEKTGKKFTFYDAMGIGMFTGKKKNINAGIRISHFSNGNIFPQNDGVKVPLTFSVGYVLE